MIAMLLDNHYGPDRRVAFECSLLAGAGSSIRIVAWDRRSPASHLPEASRDAELCRVSLPAPPGGGIRSIIAMSRWSRKVYRERVRLLDGANLLVVHDVYLLPLGYLLARSMRIPFVYDAHEDFALLEAGRYPAVLRWLVARFESLLGRRARAVVVPGNSRTARWKSIARETVVLPNLGSDSSRSIQPTPSPTYDLVHCGGIDPVRRVGLLLDLAERRPDLRIAVAGSGRVAAEIEERAGRMTNVDFFGWVSDPDSLLSDSAAIYYHYDPAHPYSSVACPNTLYQALRVQRPLIYICGGEPEMLNRRFRIGIAPEPTVAGLEAALNEIAARDDWEFEEAWGSVADDPALERYVPVIQGAAGTQEAAHIASGKG
jgi:hypothetical protein